jgi:hypothetical protein
MLIRKLLLQLLNNLKKFLFMRQYFLQILESKNLSVEGSVKDNLNFLLTNKKRSYFSEKHQDFPIFFGFDNLGEINEQIKSWEPRALSLNPEKLDDIRIKNLTLEIQNATRRDF